MGENRWRKIEVRMWGDEKFRALSPMQPSGQALWVFLLTGPHTGPIPGLFRAGRAALAEELNWSLEAFDKAFQEASGLGMVKADWQARVVFIPKAIKCNPPQSPNVVTSWAGEWQLIPECDLKLVAYAVLKLATCNFGKSFTEAFDKAFGVASTKTMPNQEQEQEQEQEIKSTGGCAPEGGPILALGEPEETWSAIQRSTPTTAQLDALYKLYPRKCSPFKAKEAIKTAVAKVMRGDPDHPSMALPEALDYLAARLKLYRECVQGRDRTYIPHPTTWFNRGDFWSDEADWKPAGNSGKKPNNGFHNDGDDRRFEKGADLVCHNE